MVGLLTPRPGATSSSEVAWNPCALNMRTAARSTASRFSSRSARRSSVVRNGDACIGALYSQVRVRPVGFAIDRRGGWRLADGADMSRGFGTTDGGDRAMKAATVQGGSGIDAI